MSLVFLFFVADVIVVVAARLLPFFIMMTIRTIQRFVFYMPLLAVGGNDTFLFLGTYIL